MAETDERQFEQRLLGHLLRPSYLSAMVAIGSALIILGSALVTRLYGANGWAANIVRTVTDSNRYVFANFGGAQTNDGGSTLNAILLFLFWALVGLMVYYFVVGLFRAASEARELEQEVNVYVHRNRYAVIRNFAERMLTRIAGLSLLFLVMVLYLTRVIPYSLTVGHSISLEPIHIISVAVAFALLVVMVHLITVLMRLVALRPRLFSVDI